MKGAGAIYVSLFVSLAWVPLRFLWLANPEQIHHHAVTVALAAGLVILASAFLLSWAGEVAQLDISQALALAFLAFVAILPEYSVDMYFSWKAGRDPAYLEFPVANMTGANRLLIGVGWPAVLLVHWWRSRERSMALGEERRLELGFLLLATLYSLTLPLRGHLSLVDAVVFVALFVFYMRAASRLEATEPELLGPAAAMARLPPFWRRLAVVGCFLVAAIVILLAAEPFAESLLASGRRYGVSEFLLVQWLAPLASEAPEFIIALLFTWRGLAGAGLGTLVSSKVNQWTLLVGLIPAVYALSAWSPAPMVLSARQADELLLTSAQSAFAIAIMADLRMAWWEALLLFFLFVAQFAFPGAEAHHTLAVGYLVGTTALLLSSAERRRNLWLLIQSPFRQTPTVS